VPVFEPKKLEEIAYRIFRAAGSPDETARTVAEHLVGANLTGHDSHGMIRIPQYIASIKEGKLSPDVAPVVVQETPTTAQVDGKRTFGQVVGKFAAEVAIEKARKSSISGVSIRNTGHLGRLGMYPEMCAEAGMASIMYCGGGGMYPSQVPFGGKEPRFGTNPIAMACPSDMDGPILLDYATSVAAEGKLRVHRNRGHKLPDGWIVDAEGNPTNDPNAFYDGGALMPIGATVAHKGYALAYMVELFGSLLPGWAYSDEREIGAESSNGGFLIAFDPKAFMPAGEMFSRTRRMTDYVKSSPVAEDFPYEEVLYPGEKEAITRRERSTEGIEIEDATWDLIDAVMREYGVGEA
jgi:uncharacterized oxidoreductase